MEDFLATVRSISSDKNYVQLADYLNRSNELLVKCAGQLDAAIASLDPDQHSLAFMALLLVKLSLPNYGDFELIFSQIQQFITICSKEQVQFAGDKFAHLCHFITQCLVDLKQPMRGIRMMCIAIQKAQQLPTQLTSIHTDLAQIEDGDIYASINLRDGMVSFHQNPEKYNNPRMLKKLDSEMRLFQRLDEKLEHMDRELATNPQYVQKCNNIISGHLV
ncbi:COP9 signalosome complex subunit 3-like isoform X2 [Orbicella faveolata]|uniref:COP9 signalosome complex subunit 3-like isoform X2 n=1 Tax=Orbicella faveolata TaxID=48498 RepID=UPI0009E40477|nr:COP9 signalosome complex subunit 3-like isoform X2 [Orbicella faveolata]